MNHNLKIKIQYEWEKFKETGYQNNKVYIKEIPPKGLGVFAKENISNGEVVEMCHTFISEIPSKYIQDNSMTEYMLPGIINNEAHPAFAFGFGCIYNSSESEEERNVDWTVIPESKLSVFVAYKDIKKDEELLAWFGEGFYEARCRPKASNELKQEIHKKIDDKLSLIKLPNSENNILKDKITKLLEIDYVNNKFNVKLKLINTRDKDTNTFLENNCVKYLKEIDLVNNVLIEFE